MRVYPFFVQSLLGRGIYLISLFLLNIFIANRFGAAGSGWIFYISSLYAFFLLVIGFCVESALSYYMAQKKITEKEAFFISIIWTLLVSVVAFLGLLYFFKDFNRELSEKQFLFLSLAFITGNMLITFFVPLFYVKKSFLWPNLILAAINILLILGGLVSEWTTTVRYLQLYFYSFIVGGLMLAIFFFVSYRNKGDLNWPSRITWHMLFRYAALAFIANLTTFLLFRIDYWFVNRYCDDLALGNYIQVSKLAQLFFSIPAILASAVFPMTAGGLQKEMNSSIQFLSRTIFLFFGLISLLLAATGGWLFPYLFGKSFDGMYLPFILMVPGILMICMIYPITSYYAGRNLMRVNIKGCFFGLCVLIAGDIILVPEYGINGAAVVCSLSYIAYGVFILLKFRTDYKVSMLHFFLIQKSDFVFLNRLLNIKQANGVQ
jgi:O-antigen/teichoic acid export membrane protein